MIKFSKDKVLLLHKLIAQETGGSIGIRDEALLDSALENAFAGFDGQEFYPTKEPSRRTSDPPSRAPLPFGSPYPTNKSPFPAQSTGKGGFLIHPQNFSCSPLTIPLS